jgi:thioredoxin 1
MTDVGFFKTMLGSTTKPGKPMETTDETFDADVLKSDLPVLVDFWSPTCMPCQVMGGLLRELGPEYAGRVNIFKLNVAQNMQTAMRYKIRSIPTLIFMKNGRIVEQAVGLLPIDQLRHKLNRLSNAPVAQKL